MKIKYILLPALLTTALVSSAQNVTIKAKDRPAAEVFRSIMEQTDKNFVYSSDLLNDLRINVEVKNTSLRKTLEKMFHDTDIRYEIKGKNVILRRKQKKNTPKPSATRQTAAEPRITPDLPPSIITLDTLEVVSQSEMHPFQTAKMGGSRITGERVTRTPVMFGESDVVKAMQMLPGVSEANEAMAGMNVHGGDADENMCLLDNMPLYQIEHFAGLFSPFNADIVKHVDFYRTSIPARLDGRLSSFLDVRLKDGNKKGHHGSARLGLTSGAFNISGPIGAHTTYLVGMRRSWLDVITIPTFAIASAFNNDETYSYSYHFSDINARIHHWFSEKLSAFVNAYYGDDLLRTTNKLKEEPEENYYYKDKYIFNWGNILVNGGAEYEFNPALSAEFTAGFSRYFSKMEYDDFGKHITANFTDTEHIFLQNSNSINAFSARGDFKWDAGIDSRVSFGAGYTRHSFLPDRTYRRNIHNDVESSTRTMADPLGANEVNAYIDDDWKISDRLHAEGGFHASLFNIKGKTKWGLSPRLSLSYTLTPILSIKGAYSRTVQYVHKIEQTYLSLPCDRWVPVADDFKPMTADKTGIGAYWQTTDGVYSASIEGYLKYMHNILDYRDQYYLYPSSASWSDRLTAGKGYAKGIDIMIEKRSGKITGHLSYSLAWADRQFADRNGGHRYPARFDHRHTVKIFLNWDISPKVAINALWTGHSGNHFTLLPQRYEEPDFNNDKDSWISSWNSEVPLKAPVNNYQLPFYHRLDLTCTVKNRRGYWTFSLYNAYCNMNTIAIVTGYTNSEYVWTPEGYLTFQDSRPVFQKLKLLPVIPSVSYTWQF